MFQKELHASAIRATQELIYRARGERSGLFLGALAVGGLLRAVTAKVHAAPAPRVPAEDRMIMEANQVFMAERMKAKIVTAAADHTPSLTAPDVVVQAIVKAIAEL